MANFGTISGGTDQVASGLNLAAGMVTVTSSATFGPLSNYGGSTPTLALLAGSPAIATGNPNPAATLPLPGLGGETITESGLSATDQRGLARLTTGRSTSAHSRASPTSSRRPATAAPARFARRSPTTPTACRSRSLPRWPARPSHFKASSCSSNDLTIDGTAAPGLILSGVGVTRVIEVAQARR